MKEFTLNYVKRTKQENCYQDSKSIKKTVLFKKMVELPHIWKKSKRCKSKNETKPPTYHDGSLYFLPSNQTVNLYQNVSLTEINQVFSRADEWVRVSELSVSYSRINLFSFYKSNLKSVVNNPIHINLNGSNQNLLDTGVVGGFEYWDGGLIELPN